MDRCRPSCAASSAIPIGLSAPAMSSSALSPRDSVCDGPAAATVAPLPGAVSPSRLRHHRPAGRARVRHRDRPACGTARGSRRADRRRWPRGHAPRRATVSVPGDQHAPDRAASGAARDRPGRRRPGPQQEVAQKLIDFDREWAELMAKKPGELPPEELADFYVKTAEFPAGFLTQYPPSMVIGEAAYQDLAAGFPIGKRFKSVRRAHPAAQRARRAQRLLRAKHAGSQDRASGAMTEIVPGPRDHHRSLG
jgi:hypothetical protein